MAGVNLDDVTRMFLEAAVSATGIIVAVLWILSGDACNALRAGLALLPVIFPAIWVVSLGIHLRKHL